MWWLILLSFDLENCEKTFGFLHKIGICHADAALSRVSYTRLCTFTICGSRKAEEKGTEILTYGFTQSVDKSHESVGQMRVKTGFSFRFGFLFLNK